MRTLALLIALLSAAILVVSFASAHQDDSTEGETKTLADLSPTEKMALQAQVMQLGTPSAEHAALAKYAGTFDQDFKMWSQPGVEPITARGEAVHEVVLGGRFLRIESKGSFEMPGLGTFDIESIQYLGFDRRSERYTSIGMDTMGTYWVTAQGVRDEKAITLSGVDEGLGITQAYDFIIELVDDDTMKTSIIVHDTFQPGPFKMMETVSRRRKQ